jgi:pimeloyl-ACP methyl ester carboxylesterase
MAARLPLILLPGMGADRRMFREQIAALENLVIPDWINPEAGQTLASYARRMAETVDPGGPCFVGGASFGGMVALEMTPHLDARACFLIGSIRSPRELPRRIRMLRPLATIAPRWTFRILRGPARAMLAAGPLIRPVARSALQQFVDVDKYFMCWASLAILRWEPSSEPIPAPVLQIHGDRDRILPHRLTRPDRLVSGAGHLLTMTFPQEVNEFLRSHMETFSAS